MGNQVSTPFLLKTSIFLSLLFASCYGLYWNGASPLVLPFVGAGVSRVFFEVPLETNISLSFTYTSNLFIIQPMNPFPSFELKDGILVIVYPWKTVMYKMRISTLPPSVEILHTPSLGRGKSGLVIYRVGSSIPCQTWIEDNLGCRYYPYEEKKVWVSLVGWPLTTTRYQLKIVVEDAAQNSVEKLVSYSPLKTTYRVRTIPLAREFAKEQGTEVNLTNLTGDPLKDYNTLMAAFAKQTKVSVFELTYRRSGRGGQMFTNLPFLPLQEFAFSSLFGDERRFVLEGKVMRSSYHYGIDMVAPSNTPVVTPWGGEVKFADYNGASGNTVIIDHGLGMYSVYMHLERIDVRTKMMVRAGQQIGIIGKTGYSTGIHLHLGISIQGRYVDPTDWTNQEWLENHILEPLRRYGK
ncbi:M23 family metallopeptidase [Thermospira aquatica]|uniref:M23 family metallopeptidase n=1 Tax=Thermospira aquatica TaxID=2828656 RepID=A0AAX3BFM0_9SPIR|nr:M23 family metallopeptidase [Thermospira aquatica]URA11087.1 M23 family metallopeptidase [Thermospira aquatica]